MERKRKLEIYEEGAPGTAPNGAAPAGQPEEQTINPYTGRPYTKRYYDILAGRKGNYM